MGRTTRCLQCGAPLGRHRAACPRCGAAQPHKRLGGSVALALLIAGLAVYTLYAIVAGG